MSDTNSPRLHSSATSSADLGIRAPGTLANLRRTAQLAVVLVPVGVGLVGCSTQDAGDTAASVPLRAGLSGVRTGASMAAVPATIAKDVAVGATVGTSNVVKDEVTDTLTKASVVVEEGGALGWRVVVRTLTAPFIGAINYTWGSVNTSVKDVSATTDKVVDAVTSSGSNIRSGK